jgi:hypothetical protein
MCSYREERVTFETAAERCAEVNKSVCVWHEAASRGMDCGYDQVYTWLDLPCQVQIQVWPSGSVSLVHEPSTDEHFQLDTLNTFRVRWQEGKYPTVATGCGSGCSVHGQTCLCNTELISNVPFDGSSITTPQEVDDLLRVGSAPPDAFDMGAYRRCTSPVCNAMKAHVEVWLGGNGDAFDADTIFKVDRNGTAVYLRNELHTVRLGGAYSFRNPPRFLSFVRGLVTEHELAHETDAMIEHLLKHQNTPPFMYTSTLPALCPPPQTHVQPCFLTSSASDPQQLMSFLSCHPPPTTLLTLAAYVYHAISFAAYAFAVHTSSSSVSSRLTPARATSQLSPTPLPVASTRALAQVSMAT